MMGFGPQAAWEASQRPEPLRHTHVSRPRSATHFRGRIHTLLCRLPRKSEQRQGSPLHKRGTLVQDTLSSSASATDSARSSQGGTPCLPRRSGRGRPGLHPGRRAHFIVLKTRRPRHAHTPPAACLSKRQATAGSAQSFPRRQKAEKRMGVKHWKVLAMWGKRGPTAQQHPPRSCGAPGGARGGGGRFSTSSSAVTAVGTGMPRVLESRALTRKSSPW